MTAPRNNLTKHSFDHPIFTFQSRKLHRKMSPELSGVRYLQRFLMPQK